MLMGDEAISFIVLLDKLAYYQATYYQQQPYLELS